MHASTHYSSNPSPEAEGRMIRAFQPTDLSGLVMLASRSLANLACPRERLGETSRRVRAGPGLVAAWMVPGREQGQTFLWTPQKGGGGLLSCRSRAGYSTWEAELLLLDSMDAEEFCQEFLGKLGPRAAEAGMMRLFLRLTADSPLRESVQKAGFTPYVQESLYVRRSWMDGLAPEPPSSLRGRRPADDLALQRLYNRATPYGVRLAEGITLPQWQESMAVRWRAGRSGSEWVLERDDAPIGWLRTARAGKAGYLSLYIHPDRPEVFLDLVEYGLARLSGRNRTYCLLPEYQAGYITSLERLGFEKTEDFVSFVWEAPAKVQNPGLVPAQIA